jgi:DNA primase
MAAAQAWFVERICLSEGAKARAYLATRGFDAHTVAALRLRLCARRAGRR